MPQSSKVTEFLKSRQQGSPVNTSNWDDRRREWIDAVERLYQTITVDLLAEPIQSGLVSISRVDKDIEEEYLGTYRVQELLLHIGGETVRFSPKGRNVMGAKGRVDLVGELDSMTLLLEPDGQWSLVLSRVPRQLVPFDDRTLADALRRIMR